MAAFSPRFLRIFEYLVTRETSDDIGKMFFHVRFHSPFENNFWSMPRVAQGGRNSRVRQCLAQKTTEASLKNYVRRKAFPRDESLRFSSRIFSFFPPSTFESSREIHFAIIMIIYNNNSDKFERKKERKDQFTRDNRNKGEEIKFESNSKKEFSSDLSIGYRFSRIFDS